MNKLIQGSRLREVAEMLGLEWNHKKSRTEVFKIDKFKDKLFFITHIALYYDNEDGIVIPETHLLVDLICGNAKIVKIPWMPTEGELVFISLPTDPDLYSTSIYTSNDIACMHWKEKGLIFPTQHQAIEASKKMLEAINNTSPESHTSS